jgi:hypothetical protein
MTKRATKAATVARSEMRHPGVVGATASRRVSSGVGRLVRRLDRERRQWSAVPVESEIPTEQAWRAGVAEGIRLAQLVIRKGV